MITILFVDDDSNVLNGIRRLLHPMRREWEMQFTDNGEDALIALSEKSFDIVVSDMCMPDMDGIELLTKVMHSYPRTIRLALSGHAEIEKILEAARVAHQYLAKPCDSVTLIDTIKQACGLRELFDNPELASVLGGIDNLPSLPELYMKFMDEIADPDSDMVRVGEIISKDVAMATKVLQLVNSAFFGMTQHISSVSHAASILGLNTIKGLVIITQAFNALDALGNDFDMEGLWEHSFKTAALAARIAALESDEKRIQDHAYIAGLLHDVGKLVLATRLTDQYQRFQTIYNAGELSLTDAECEVFGCSHAEVGAYLLNIWGFPNPVVEALAFHHAPQKSVGDSFTALTAIYAAQVLLRHVGNSALADDDAIDIDLSYLQRIGKDGQIPVWIAECRDFIQEANANANG